MSSVPIESPDIRDVYLKDRAGVRSYQFNENRLPQRIRDIRRKLAEEWKKRELLRTPAR